MVASRLLGLLTLLFFLRSIVVLAATSGKDENLSQMQNADLLLPHRLPPRSMHQSSAAATLTSLESIVHHPQSGPSPSLFRPRHHSSELPQTSTEQTGIASSRSSGYAVTGFDAAHSDGIESERRGAFLALPSLLRLPDDHIFPTVAQKSESVDSGEGENQGEEATMAMEASLIGKPKTQVVSTNGGDVLPEGRGVATETVCPASCFMPDPVCGKDGVTYWCGGLDAACAGMEVEHAGYCQIGSDGAGSKAGLAMQSLLLVHMLWLVLAAGLVLLGVP